MHKPQTSKCTGFKPIRIFLLHESRSALNPTRLCFFSPSIPASTSPSSSEGITSGVNLVIPPARGTAGHSQSRELTAAVGKQHLSRLPCAPAITTTSSPFPVSLSHQIFLLLRRFDDQTCMFSLFVVAVNSPSTPVGKIGSSPATTIFTGRHGPGDSGR